MLKHLAVTIIMLMSVRSDDLMPITDVAQHPTLACDVPAAKDQSGMRRCGSDRSSIWVCSSAKGWIADLHTPSCLLVDGPSRTTPCCSDNGNLNEVYCNPPAKNEGGVKYC